MQNDGEVPLPCRNPILLYYEGTLIQTAGITNQKYCVPFLYRYSLIEQKWEVISDKNSSFSCRYLCQGFIHEHKLFIIYGWLVLADDESQDVVKFDLKSEHKKWEETKLFPELASSDYSTVKVENTVYHFGGYHFSIDLYTNKFSKIDLNTFEVITINDFLIFPKQRALHSLVLINEKIYLFGGVNGDQIFNDLWTFDLLTYRWNQVSIKGSIPSPRYLHAAGAEGNVFVIWGGEDSSGLKDDLFIFNTLSGMWTELLSISFKPKSAKGACLVMKNYQVYLYGGKTYSDVSNELWKYHFGINSFEYISKSEDYYTAYSQCWIDSDLFYVSLGAFINEGPSAIIKTFNFSSSKWSEFHNHGKNRWDSSQSVQVFVGNQFINIGGHSWGTEIINNISVLGPGTQLKVFDISIDLDIFASASVYYKKTLYIFGGGLEIGGNLMPRLGHNLLFNINLGDICENGDCQALCSLGTYAYQGDCKVCPSGTFNDELGSLKCIECKPGTFNKYRGSTSSQQCVSCEEGTFNNKKGAEICQICPKDKHCPVGSTNYSDKKKSIFNGSIQPSLYEDPDLNRIKIIYQTLVSVLLFLLMIILLSFKKLRIHAKKLDLFDDKHNNPDSKFIIRKKTQVGACFSFLVVIGSLLLTCSTVLEYFKANIEETKGLITLNLLESEVDIFTAEEFIVQVLLHSYGGECEKDLRKSSIVSSLNIEYSHQIITYEKFDNISCKIIITSNHAIINAGAQFIISLKENHSFSSGIEVNISSSSSIPDQISSVFSLIHSGENSVFIGSVPSEFYFLATPSLFKSQSNRWISSATGYHISQRSSPKPGSQFMVHEFSSVSYLNVKILIEKGLTGLLTLRKLKQSFIFFAGSLLGTISGLFGVAAFIMTYFEVLGKKLLRKTPNKKASQVEIIQNDFSLSTIVKIDSNTKT